MIEKKPIIFKPYLKNVIWGGNKICKYKNIPAECENIGESWEISAVPGFESVVEYGTYKGTTLNELVHRFGKELLGEKVERLYNGKFPLLVKIIDANDNLSVQVHPNDKLAMQRHGCPGKTEMWYIIDAQPGAKIYAGLNTAMTPEEYEDRVASHTFAETVSEHESVPGDMFFLPAGRVHAIGAGNLLAEIQQSSDITYRIYDYDRLDASGKPRTLHTNQAKDAIDFTVRDDYKTPAPPKEDRDYELVNCEYFNTRRVIIDGRQTLDFDPDSFTVIICIEGKIKLLYPEGQMEMTAGHTVLLPAVLSTLKCEGKATLLIAQA